MDPTHRLPCEGFSPSVRWIADFFGVDNRMATLLIWEVAFTVGTDRHYWITESVARRFIDNNQPLAV